MWRSRSELPLNKKWRNLQFAPLFPRIGIERYKEKEEKPASWVISCWLTLMRENVTRVCNGLNGLLKHLEHILIRKSIKNRMHSF